MGLVGCLASAETESGQFAFYYEDTTTGKQLSLRTKDEAEARTLLNAKNESFRQPVLNRQIARTYLAATDSAMATRIRLWAR